MEKSTTRPRRIAAHYIHTPQGVLQRGVVSIDGNGIITDVTTSDNIDSLEGVEHYSGMLTAGFVNAHSHLELSYLHNAITQGSGFAGFAAAMSRVRGEFTPEQRTQAAAFYDARMWVEGVDAVADICNGDTTFAIKEASRIKYTNFLELFGLQTDSIETLSEVSQSAEAHNLTYTITPHSTYSLNSKAFNQAIRKSRPTLPLSIHFMESEAESDLFYSCGDLWSWYQDRGLNIDFQQYESPAKRIIDTIPADRKIMLIHSTYVTGQDVDLLQSHFGDNLTWVLCPRSNDYISRSQPCVDLLLKVGGRIAVGTDSLASNYSLSMIDELKMFEEIPLTTLLNWATIGGAEALGIDADYGSIEAGKKSGIVLLTDLDWQTMKLTKNSRSKRIL